MLDSNVLLNLYLFTRKSRLEFFEALDRVKDRLWVPHQVAAEFHANRLAAAQVHMKMFDATSAALASVRRKAEDELTRFGKAHALTKAEIDTLVSPIVEAIERSTEAVRSRANDFDITVDQVVVDDPILRYLGDLLDGHTGTSFSPAERADLEQEFRKRAQEEVPPGYLDAQKSTNASGDFLMWEQILREAQSNSRPILLVTNEVKQDWVLRSSGFTVGARPELVQEMHSRAAVDFLLMDAGAFLYIVNEIFDVSLSDSTMEQAERPLPADVERIVM
ncbi:PIN-like domain-containing protein [Streptomyces rochei]|uniref:PIN-like domain-containing protein n=1 Tax=Streptomyces rochei TaxID=1928 RepID=UPI00363A50FD